MGMFLVVALLGIAVLGLLSLVGKVIEWHERRESRRCKKCGKVGLNFTHTERNFHPFVPRGDFGDGEDEFWHNDDYRVVATVASCPSCEHVERNEYPEGRRYGSA